jgi:thiol peroxidase
MNERHGEYAVKGHPLTVLGEKLAVGDQAPGATLIANNWAPVDLADWVGKVRLISVVPSLDTSVCDAQTRRFNEEAAGLGEDVVVLTISTDLPPAQKRWCGAAGVERVITLSDHKEMAFAQAYGTYVKEQRLEQRAVFVVDRDGTIQYAEYVPDMSQQPNYEASLTVARALY